MPWNSTPTVSPWGARSSHDLNTRHALPDRDESPEVDEPAVGDAFTAVYARACTADTLPPPADLTSESAS